MVNGGGGAIQYLRRGEGMGWVIPLRSSEELRVRGFHENGERGAPPVCLEVEVDGRLGPCPRVLAVDAAVNGHPGWSPQSAVARPAGRVARGDRRQLWVEGYRENGSLEINT